MKQYFKIGQKLQGYRLARGITAQQIADKLSKSRSYITRLENGYEKPNLGILIRLIRHYSLSRQEAEELHQLAGYPVMEERIEPTLCKGKEVKYELKQDDKANIDAGQVKNNIQINMPADLHVLYTDSMWVHLSPFGLTLDFAQTVGPNNQQQTIVSRIGMSREHARAMLKVIQQKLDEEDFTRGQVVAKA